MKTSRLLLGICALFLTGGTLASAQAVLAPAKRQQSLDRGKALVTLREVVPTAVDPFYPAAFKETVASMGRAAGGPTPPVNDSGPAVPATPTGPRNDRELLQAIATSLKPSGYIVLNNEPSLSFGQKRVKAGGTMTINFEGNQYTLEVVSIDRTNFTLRLNREEFTRTIK
jgi:hypothetical protein